MHNTWSDEKLVERVLGGDRIAYKALIERHYSNVLRLSIAILSQKQDAEDAVQEIFLRAFSALGQFSGTGPFAAWLRRLTVNHCLNRKESGQRLAQHVTTLDPVNWSLLPAVTDDPEELLLKSERESEFKQKLDALPLKQRTALALRLIEELSYEEIAEQMDEPINSVRSWIHRGRLRLSEELEEVARCR